MTIEAIKQEATSRMTKSVESLKQELLKIRTGRAHASLLDHITVEYYGSRVPIQQMASITVSDARTLLISPWEKNAVNAIEKAILESDLGINPVTVGTAIRVPLPPLTEQRRRDLVKVVRHQGEEAKVSVRNIRRDANEQLKKRVKDKTISEDEERRATDVIQKLTDKCIADIEKVLIAKEAELMEI